MSKHKQIFESFKVITPTEVADWLQDEFKSIDKERWMTKYGLAEDGIALIAVKYSENTVNLFTWEAFTVTNAPYKRLGQVAMEMRKTGERTQIIGYCDNDQLQPFLKRLQAELERVFPPTVPDSPRKKTSTKGKPRSYTESNLSALLEERRRNRNPKTGEIRRGIYPTCKALNMKPDTIKKHWPKLAERWKDPTYSPKPKDFITD